MADILYDTRGKYNDSPKVVILTHGDADGLVSALVVKLFEELQDRRKTFLIMSSMDVTLEQTDKTFSYICNYTQLGKRDKVYILDRPIPSLEWLKMQYLSHTNVINIDHHLTNHPDIYKDESCCSNIIYSWDDKVSAAYLTLEWFKQFVEKEEKYKKMYDRLKPLVEATSCWDIFSWKSLGSSQEEILLKKRALSINSAEKILGGEAFYNFISKRTNSDRYIDEIFNYFYLLDEAYTLKLDSIFTYAKRVIYDFPFKKYKFGILYGIDGDYQSIIADKIFMDKKLNYDIVAFLNVYGTVSFRSKNDVDVSIIAKKLGEVLGHSGGGHKNASGCRIFDREDIRKRIIESFENAMEQVEQIL